MCRAFSLDVCCMEGRGGAPSCWFELCCIKTSACECVAISALDWE